MLVKKNNPWNIGEKYITDEKIYLNRRNFIKNAAIITTAAATGPFTQSAQAWSIFGNQEENIPEEKDPTTDLYPARKNEIYKAGRPLTEEKYAATYNNFYEFGSHKTIAQEAQKLRIRPWEVLIDGDVEEPFKIDIDTLIRKVTLEERIYRHRCVEAWAMTVPWTGFPMKKILEIAKPLAKAKYVRMETFHNPEIAKGQNQPWYPWPYVEAVTVKEAAHDLAFLVTGVYGKPAAKQFGAPIRLALPWKYGFKSIKSIVRFQFTEQKPTSFWEEVQGSEYGFWANVNPNVPHPRWSQKTERLLGQEARVPTKIYNGYGEYVAQLYADMPQNKNLFF